LFWEAATNVVHKKEQEKTILDIIAALHQEASKLENQLSAVRIAIGALNGTSKHVAVETSRPRKTMSAAGRRRIALATKRRWAKYRAEKNGKPRRVMSAATKLKISRTAKARWAAKKK
jgi:hypothetical protein